jgi:hypothetical protein
MARFALVKMILLRAFQMLFRRWMVTLSMKVPFFIALIMFWACTFSEPFILTVFNQLIVSFICFCWVVSMGVEVRIFLLVGSIMSSFIFMMFSFNFMKFSFIFMKFFFIFINFSSIFILNFEFLFCCYFFSIGIIFISVK